MPKQSTDRKTPAAKRRKSTASRPTPTKVDVSKLPREADPGLKLLWVDSMQLGVRADIPIATLRFFSTLGDRVVEACRVQTSVKHLQSIADIICRNLDYYPKPPAK